MASGSTTTVRSPSDDAYTAALSPAGPAPITATSNDAEIAGVVQQAERRGDLHRVGVDQHRAFGPEPEHHDRQLGIGQTQGTAAAPGPSGRGRIVETGRHVVADEHVPQLLGPRGPLLADQLDRLVRAGVPAGPLVQQFGDGEMELLVAGRLRAEHPGVDRPESRWPRTPGRPLSSSPQRTTQARSACAMAGPDPAPAPRDRPGRRWRSRPAPRRPALGVSVELGLDVVPVGADQYQIIGRVPFRELRTDRVADSGILARPGPAQLGSAGPAPRSSAVTHQYVLFARTMVKGKGRYGKGRGDR